MRLIEINKIAEASEKISALVRTTECQKSNYFSKLFNTNMASDIKENYPLKISAIDSNSISIFFCALS